MRRTAAEVVEWTNLSAARYLWYNRGQVFFSERGVTMRARVLLVMAALGLLLASGKWEPPVETAGLPSRMLGLPTDGEFCLLPPEGAAAYRQTRGGGAGRVLADEPPRNSGAWLPGPVEGGDIMPARSVFDPYPTFDAVAVDAEVGRAFFSDASLSSLLSYDVTATEGTSGITEHKTRVLGPDTGIGFIAGADVDPERKEVYAVNNDGGGIVVFGYDQTGAVRPVRHFETPHQSWAVSVSPPRNEVAVTVQQLHGLVFYTRDARDMDPPVRSLRGEATGLADPHGVDYDESRKELVVANHGNWTQLRPYSPYDPLSKTPAAYEPGRFEPPSIRIYPASAEGNTKPLRSITGSRTGLNWPMGLEVDEARDEIVVANYGDNSVRFYRRTADGDVQPVRTIKGADTGLIGPVDVSLDVKRNEIWVANYSDHTAVVFDRTASGNAKPKRIVRNAPKGTPALTFTNAAAAAYDTKRDALIVPN
jgi:DNA-binding beta-propeller fold protein YncE